LEQEALDELAQGDALAMRVGFGYFEHFGLDGEGERTLSELWFELRSWHGLGGISGAVFWRA
jgi:hypothetical protein